MMKYLLILALAALSFGGFSQEVISKKEYREIKKKRKKAAKEQQDGMPNKAEENTTLIVEQTPTNSATPQDVKPMILPNLVNPVSMNGEGDMVFISVKLRFNTLKFTYKTGESGVRLMDIEEDGTNGSFDVNFIEDALDQKQMQKQKAEAINATPLQAIAQLLKPALKQDSPFSLDDSGKGNGLFWGEDYVYVGDVEENYPHGNGKQYDFEGELEYEGEFHKFFGWNGHGKANIDGDIWEGKFQAWKRMENELYKVTHVSPRDGSITESEGYWNPILYRKVGLWHATNANGSMEEIDFGENGDEFELVMIKHADVNGNVNSFDDIIKSIRNHLNQFELYYYNGEDFDMTTNYQLITSDYELENNSEEYYFIVLEKGSTVVPQMQFTRPGELDTAVDIPLEIDQHYTDAFGYPVYYTLFATDENDVAFDVRIKGSGTAKAMMVVMGAKSEDLRWEPAPCPHGYVTE